MSSRATRTALLLVSSSLVLVAGSLLAGGCTQETIVMATPDAGDAGVDAKKPATDSGPAEEPDAEEPEQTEEECLQACEDNHKAGLVKDKAIETCWASKCQGPCVDETGFDAGTSDGGDADGGDAGDAGAPMCTEEVATFSESCDLCTTTNCCASWDACFQDDDCVALNECRNACLE